MAYNIEIPKSAEILNNLSPRLWLNLIMKFKIAYAGRRKSEDPIHITNNYISSWGKVYKKKKWLECSTLDELINPNNGQYIIATLGGKWVRIKSNEYLQFREQALYQSVVSNLNSNNENSTIIEIGSGWGRNLFILRSHGFKGKLVGYELTDEGVNTAREISKHYSIKDIEFHKLDVVNETIDAKNSLIFTYHCFEQIKYHTSLALENMINSSPTIVLQFEPLPELFKKNYLRDKMCLFYNKLIDYQDNLLFNLKSLENDNKLTIISAARQGYYSHPLQETSLVIWKPNIKNKHK